jgi:hypothetical protein
MKPTLFIGSSSESLTIAENLQSNLDKYAEVTVWNQGVFRINESTFQSLLRAVEDFDFACMILGEEDIAIMRGTKKMITRDNVIFEMGLFLGRLGKDRVFILYEHSHMPDLPSDLLGITFLDFDLTSRSDKNYKAALAPASLVMREYITKYGKKASQGNVLPKRRVDATLERGSTRFLDVVVDGALYVADTEAPLKRGLIKAIMSGGTVPMKYLYCTDEGCRFWLEICRWPEYTFYHKSVAQLRSEIGEIAAISRERTKSYAFDLISLGSGNGEKDNLILRELCNGLHGSERNYYYPIDINAEMLVQAVKGAMPGIERDKVNVKAIVGDILTVQQFRSIYEERATINFFSILGNTLGNNDEKFLFRALREAMLPGDLILIEVNVQKGRLTSMVMDEIYQRHDFVPLKSLGVEFNPESMHYLQKTDLSEVPDTLSTIASYESAVIDGRTIKDIQLSIVHHYNPTEFVPHVENALSVNNIYASNRDGVGLFLFHRPFQKTEGFFPDVSRRL